MVMDEVRVIDEERRSAKAAGFAKLCAWSKMERDRTGKTQLAKSCSHGAIVNQVTSWVDLSSPNRGWSSSVLPVNVSSTDFNARSTMSF